MRFALRRLAYSRQTSVLLAACCQPTTFLATRCAAVCSVALHVDAIKCSWQRCYRVMGLENVNAGIPSADN